MHSFPKTIWMLWLQGWERAPLLVQACRRSWEVNNPGWTIHCLDQRTVADFIGNFEARGALDDPDQPPEACSDRVRVALLAQHGGIWADATTYCLWPLNDWLLDVLGSGFFALIGPGQIDCYRLGFLPLGRATISFKDGRKERSSIGKEGNSGITIFGFIIFLGMNTRKTPTFASSGTIHQRYRLPDLTITYRKI